MENCRKNCGNFLEGIEFRPMDVSEYPLLADFLYEAIFLPPGVIPPPREVIELPELQPYIADFGKDGDFCLCAVQGTQVIGAACADICRDTAVWRICRSWQFPFCRPFEERASAQFF